ncbi:hypothetical protein E2C01_065160 [Portunus trituberculatus]|uniref:Uncharacterized protein n=1 Tax=Portunus trituberculatus TaxID=210409 RepID=A0A5B7HQB5_PORTR|nr:hypothetical protein [Portunus trituberculatus]
MDAAGERKAKVTQHSLDHAIHQPTDSFISPLHLYLLSKTLLFRNIPTYGSDDDKRAQCSQLLILARISTGVSNTFREDE